MKKFTSKSQKAGQVGENIAARYLESKGLKIIEKNHTKKWGEIDIIARDKKKLVFVEVKSVFCKGLEEGSLAIRPEENLHREKMLRLRRVIQTYLSQNKIPENQAWCFDLACVFMDEDSKKAKVRVIENIIL